MKKIVFIPLCACFFYACEEVDPKDCEMAVCSEQFNSVYLQVRDTLQQPIALDTFKIINMMDMTPVVLPVTDSIMDEMRHTGDYLVLNDLFVRGHENTRVVVEFTGVLKEKPLFKRAVTVDIDCCHISPVYGELSVVVDTLQIR
ncbi:MAG: hypothetical protein LBF90_00685 [Prevotellaceae bacterium]|jgi:hypothetical protein|nr:hypothetical protein [Prevotellaceae bacterium]